MGDVIIATETVEHDIRNRFGPPQMPRFETAVQVLDHCRSVTQSNGDFAIHFAAIASGVEDVVDEDRRAEVRTRTGAVAWEGAGGARACRLSGVPFVEIRGISDGADSTAAGDFVANLPLVMRNVATLVASLAGHNSRDYPSS